MNGLTMVVMTNPVSKDGVEQGCHCLHMLISLFAYYLFNRKWNVHRYQLLNSLLAGDGACRLLITFANSLKPDHARRPDLGANCLALWWHTRPDVLKTKLYF